MRILVVEDEPQLLEIIVAALDSENDITEMATDFSGALDRIVLYDYDCIVLDNRLPEGRELFEELKKRGKSDSVLIVSSHDSKDDFPEGSDHGTNRLKKPFHLAELIARVKAIGHCRDLDAGQLMGDRRQEDAPEVNINMLCASLIEDLLEIAEHRSVHIAVEEDAQLVVRMYPDLAVILLANLIRNGLVHNVRNGTLHIRIADDALTIENTGKTQPLDPGNLFGSGTEPSGRRIPGLGLAVVRSICELSGLAIRYAYNGKHVFELTSS